MVDGSCLIVGDATLYCDRSETVLPTLSCDAIDSIVTDPPYGLGFMGKKWDIGVPAVELFRECLRVLKPGGHLLAFGGPRTYHRLAVAVEDAGFEIRDQIMWIYGSGFPKSQNVSKAIDRAEDYKLQALVRRAAVPAVEKAGLVLPGNSRHGWTVGEHAPGDKWWAEFQRWLPGLTDTDRKRIEGEILREVQKTAGWFTTGDIYTVRAPATDEARQWDGWGTALKPAHEPILVARKPLDGTVAANVQRHGTGAINVDGCRVPGPKPDTTRGAGGQHGRFSEIGAQGRIFDDGKGRWPANVIHDGSDEVVDLFPNTASNSGEPFNRQSDKFRNTFGKFDGRPAEKGYYGDAGSAARFFYCAKASRKDRNEGCEALAERPLLWSSGTQSPGTFQAEGTKRAANNNHPTVKPTDLMRYLCRLVTPPGGTVLDPLMGSGSTGKAASLEGFRFVGIDSDPEYFQIAVSRIRHVSLHRGLAI